MKVKRKEIRTVKVLWDKATQEMTREMEDLLRQSYSHLFLVSPIFEDKNFIR